MRASGPFSRMARVICLRNHASQPKRISSSSAAFAAGGSPPSDLDINPDRQEKDDETQHLADLGVHRGSLAFPITLSLHQKNS